MNSNQAVTFKDFSLSPELFRAIEALGFENPTPIQIETLPLLLKGKTDFLGLASTGTGKTAAFAIPLLQSMDSTIPSVQALILCPTRELAKQVAEQINLLARFKNTKCLAIYGGSDYGGQLRALKEGVSIVVGTPGRVIDHLDRGTLKIQNLKTVVLDEADEMISMGFRDEIELILNKIENQKNLQKWMFSATMNHDIRKIADRFLHQPKQVAINKASGGATSSVSQFYFPVHEDQKISLLENLIDSAADFHGLIFCQTKLLVEEITRQLKIDGYAAECLHGDMDQKAREKVMKAFKLKEVTVLVCTDVAARGIDVKDLSHVINFSLPRELENYVHRIGRTGRGGKMGIAWNLVNPSHMNLIPQIEKLTKIKMVRAAFPLEKDILKVKAGRELANFKNQTGLDESHSNLVNEILSEGEWKETLESMTKVEIVNRFLSKFLRVNKIEKSIHEPSRRKEGNSRSERRQQFLERTGKKPFPKKDRQNKEGSHHNRFEKGSVRGRSQKPLFSTFARMAKEGKWKTP
jgi:ATP-dependent RNA helicase DeaD